MKEQSGLIVSVFIIFLSAITANISAKDSSTMDAQNATNSGGQNTERITLGGGCFWCLEPIFEVLKGVRQVDAGYSGGHVTNPTYQQVCTGNTGHAEVVQVQFDPDVITLEQILKIFFTVHDPTQLNRQGPDVGTQYRSAVLYRDEQQKKATEKVIQEIEKAGIWDGSIVTEVTPFDEFYMAEQYHQEYYAKNPNQGYCRVIIAPKVAKFRKKFQDMLKKE